MTDSSHRTPVVDPRETCDTAAGAVVDARVEADRATGALEPGTMVGDWRIERMIGRGGMGTVYAAIHGVIGKRAAIKVGRADQPARTRDDAIQEAWVVNQIGHPNIVDIFHIGRLNDQRPYLVMELLSGCTLGDRLDHGRMPAIEACDVLLQVCAALDAAHRHGVVHRDLKPANIFLAETATGDVAVKVVDWGIAELIDVDGSAALPSETLIGTPEYMSPEQARGGHVDGRSDIYSLGAIAYELFLEGSPYAADSVADLLNAHVAVDPTPPSELWPDIPPVLDDLLCSMLRKAPDLRPDAAQVIEALGQVRRVLEQRRGVIIRPPSRRISTRMPADPLGQTWNTPSSELPAPTSRRRRMLRRLGEIRWGAVTVASVLVAMAMVVLGDHSTAPLSIPPALASSAAAIAAQPREPIAAKLTTCEAQADTAIHASATPAPRPVVREKRSSERRRSAPRIDPDGTIDPFE